MKILMQEKSLSRIYQHMLEHDTGFITAYRSEYTKKENQQRNRLLLAKLQSSRYGVTSVEGSYIENYKTPDAKEVGEHTFFVVDLNDSGKLERDLKMLGEEFDQDSILFVEKGAKKGVLHGTSYRDNAWPGFGKQVSLKNPVFGESGEFFTKVSGRPFIFMMESKIVEHELPKGYMARLSCKAVSKQDWREL